MWRSGRADYHRTARKAEALVANSEYTARRTANCCPGLPPISVCWPGMDIPEAWSGNDFIAVEGIGPHAMLIVGRLDTSQRHKGHDQLLEALPKIMKSVPDAQLVVAGDGDDLHRLKKRAQDLGVTQQVMFLGRADEQDLHALYEQCALFVMPSDGDGFGLVFLEAMMHRTPCVGLAGSAAEEVFENGVSGMLVDRDNREELAACLSGLLADDERRRIIGEAGFERYQQLFTGDCLATRLQDIVTKQLEIN
jgi:phosphatidylinositol alpha-1,6-mannosyltransferase